MKKWKKEKRRNEWHDFSLNMRFSPLSVYLHVSIVTSCWNFPWLTTITLLFNKLRKVCGNILDLIESQSGSVCSNASDESFNGFTSFADDPKRDETKTECSVGSKCLYSSSSPSSHSKAFARWRFVDNLRRTFFSDAIVFISFSG